MISSLQNNKVKYVRRLQNSARFRKQQRAYVIEGSRWLAEMIRFRARPELMFVTRSWLENDDHAAFLKSEGLDFSLASDEVFNSASSLENPEGVLAVLQIPEIALPENISLALILDGIADPGNMGTMLRTAPAAGVDVVILAPGCVDAYNPKVVRGGMGAHLQVAIYRAQWQQIKEMTSELSCWIASVGDHTSYDHVDWTDPSALIIGSEAAGASNTALKLFERRVSIPMDGRVNSLNAAVAAGVILMEAARQRRQNRTANQA